MLCPYAQYFFVHYEVNGGKPNSSGLKSRRELRTNVASVVALFSTRGSGTITTCMPAALAAITPFTASSKTRH